MDATVDKRFRVLIVDDSAVVRQSLTRLLESDSEIEVVGTAIDPYVAQRKINELRPEILLLDLDLPRMDGLSFLRQLMREQPMPAIVVSARVAPGSEQAIAALEAGAVDVFHKPSGILSAQGLGADLLARIKLIGRVSRKHRGFQQPRTDAPQAPRELGARLGCEDLLPEPGWNPRQIILLGASTGGTEALRDLLTKLPADLPPICIVQHIPAGFSRAFAERLNELCAFEVREAGDGDELHPGLALVAPGDFHMEIVWRSDRYQVCLHRGPQQHHQRPAVDVLFDSALKTAGPHAVAALLTGMGRDGARGLKHLFDHGAHTIAQDRATSVVFGMPQAAIELGAAREILPLDRIPEAILRALAKARARRELIAK